MDRRLGADDMIKLDDFLLGIRENENRITHYESGGDGKDGGCDCIGLPIGAVRLAGGSWTGTHGSNYAARNEILDLHQIEKGDYFVGEIVFKAREPGADGYALPDRYKTSGDLRDYYHVGIVTCINPLCITHCTGVPGGIKEDNQPGAWKYGGRLKMVEYAPEDPIYFAIVTAVSGRTVHLRKKPNLQSDILKSVPVGQTVEVYEDFSDDWARVKWNYYTGYMMRKYLMPEETADMTTEIREAIAALDRAKTILTHLIGGGELE